MALDLTFYGTLLEGDSYFAARLHSDVWSSATSAEKTAALIEARRIIDAFNFKNEKHTVYVLLLANSSASDEAIRAAEASQTLEFPRGADTVVPEQIRLAAYEIAYELLDGKDPELELENLGIESQTFGQVKTTFNRDQLPIEHLINGVPSAKAWRWLKPYLRDGGSVVLSRVS